jgi:hypothetical protein
LYLLSHCSSITSAIQYDEDGASLVLLSKLLSAATGNNYSVAV